MKLTIGIYKKTLLFWLIVGSAIALGVLSFKRYLPQPAFSLEKTSTGTLMLDVVVSEKAKVFVNDQLSASAIQPTRTADLVRLKIIDEIPQAFSSINVTVHLPKPIALDRLNAKGLLIHSFDNNVKVSMADDKTIMFSTGEIAPQAVFTVAFELPRGYLKLGFGQRLRALAAGLPFSIWVGAGLLLPGLTVTFLGLQIYKRLTFLAHTRTAAFLNQLPATTAPAVVGALHHGTISPREITATLIDLAVNRSLTIFAKKEGDFTFAKTPVEPNRNFEKVLLSKLFYEQQIFSQRLDILHRVGHRIFSDKIANVYWEIYRQLEHEGYFLQPPAKVIYNWRLLGTSLFFIGIIGFFSGVVFFPEPKFPLMLWLGVIGGGLLIERFGFLMNNFSPKGLQAMRQWAGFKNYLSLNQPVSYQEAIDGRLNKFLPYAVVFGVERQWLERFGNHPFAPPAWFDAATPVITLESFADAIFPIGGYVARLLAESRAPTI